MSLGDRLRGLMHKKTGCESPVEFIGVDLGNSAGKIAFFRGNRVECHRVPNIMGEAIPLDSAPLGADDEVLCVSVNGSEEYFLGKLADDQLQDRALQDRDRDKANSSELQYLLPALLGLYSTGKPVVLGIGTTIKDFANQAPELVKKLKGKFQVTYRYGSMAGKTVCIEVVDVVPFPQTVSGLIGLMKDDQGRVIRADWNGRTVLGLDFGGGQVNGALVKELTPLKQYSFSTDFGCYRIMGAIQDMLNAAPHFLSPSVPQLQKALEQEWYPFENRKINLEECIDNATAELVKMTVRDIKDKIPDSVRVSINDIVLLGGRADKFAAFVGVHFPNYRVEIAQSAVFANARGLLLIAKESWEERMKELEANAAER